MHFFKERSAFYFFQNWTECQFNLFFFLLRVVLPLCSLSISERKGQDEFLSGKMKQPVEINLAINEMELSDWHSRTLEWMPPMILMRYWYSSLWCSQPPQVTRGCCQTGSADLLSISLDDFLQWHSHSMSVIVESMGARDWCDYRNLNFSKSSRPPSLRRSIP